MSDRLGSVGTKLRELAAVTGYAYGWYALPIVLGILAVYYWIAGFGIDFQANVWDPGKAILHGHSPYPRPEVLALVGRTTFLYPPPLLLLDVPLALLPHLVARALMWALSAGAVYVALRLVGVRDWRVQFCAGLSFPVWYGEVFGNPTLLLLLPLAVAWRYRDRPWAVGPAVGIAVGLKLILWPLGVWLLATRRLRGAAAAVATTLVALAATWAMIGFEGLAEYPRLLRLFSETTAGPRGFTISTFVHRLGFATSLGHVLQGACGAALLMLAALVARRPDGDRRAFALAIAAALVITPVVEEKYLALLLVPLATLRPGYGRAWQLVRVAWVFALVPRSGHQVVHDDGRTLTSFARVPSIPQLLIVLGFLCAVAYLTGRDPTGARAPAMRTLWARLTTPAQQPASS